ncbi:hypothetical protein L596_002132 [Steinernema carpocapsae]|uniref:Uncharacterized protein n=1 Tax=Steinernema carpocapsae TaxID=34508 RepID=A0A4U8US98_STECR|nr:hypothetical protein L596_002132 [Steinernema carpocapsae]
MRCSGKLRELWKEVGEDGKKEVVHDYVNLPLPTRPSPKRVAYGIKGHTVPGGSECCRRVVIVAERFLIKQVVQKGLPPRPLLKPMFPAPALSPKPISLQSKGALLNGAKADQLKEKPKPLGFVARFFNRWKAAARLVSCFKGNEEVLNGERHQLHGYINVDMPANSPDVIRGGITGSADPNPYYLNDAPRARTETMFHLRTLNSSTELEYVSVCPSPNERATRNSDTASSRASSISYAQIDVGKTKALEQAVENSRSRHC